MKHIEMVEKLHKMSFLEIASFIPGNLDTFKALLVLERAAKTRYSVGCIQFENIWEVEIPKDGSTEICLSMKLSHDSLSSHLDISLPVNLLEWYFKFPKFDEMDECDKPKNFREVMRHFNMITVFHLKMYNAQEVCDYLDQIFDFNPVSKPPPNLDLS
jgi:hypothetical protein